MAIQRHLEEVASLLFIVDDQDVTFHLYLEGLNGMDVNWELRASSTEKRMDPTASLVPMRQRRSTPHVSGDSADSERGKMPRGLRIVTVGTAVGWGEARKCDKNELAEATDRSGLAHGR
jgi:hypothetical protein